MTDILIIKRENFTGGRIHASKFANNTITAGANWIHLVDEDETKRLVEGKDALKFSYNHK